MITCEPGPRKKKALFVTNDADAQFLQREEARQAIAQGYFAGIDAYFRWLTGAP